MDLKFIALAAEATAEGIFSRPVMEYTSDKLRDPFKGYLAKEDPRQLSQMNVDATKPVLDTAKLKVQGIIWGVKSPQAIINSKVLSVGDLIDGAEILSIEKNDIALSFNGIVYDLAAPGQSSVEAKIK